MQKLRSDIKGYDEYVKDFEAVCNKDYVRPKSETEIWEEMSEEMSECDEFETGERIGVTASLLGEGRSIDKKVHLFVFDYVYESSDWVRIEYAGMR